MACVPSMRWLGCVSELGAVFCTACVTHGSYAFLASKLCCCCTTAHVSSTVGLDTDGVRGTSVTPVVSYGCLHHARTNHLYYCLLSLVVCLCSGH